MKRWATLLAAFAFALTISTLRAEDYILVASDTVENSYYVDQDTVREEGRFVRYWGKLDYSKPQFRQRTNRYVTTIVGSYAVDCSRQSSTITAYVEKDSQGAIIETQTFPPSTSISPQPLKSRLSI